MVYRCGAVSLRLGVVWGWKCLPAVCPCRDFFPVGLCVVFEEEANVGATGYHSDQGGPDLGGVRSPGGGEAVSRQVV